MPNSRSPNPNQYEDKELREELRHVYGICDCDWKNMHCFYWSSNDPDFIDTLPQRQLDEAMQLITQKQQEARMSGLKEALLHIALDEGGVDGKLIYESIERRIAELAKQEGKHA